MSKEFEDNWDLAISLWFIFQICQTCKKIFKNKRCLNRHRREKHSGQAEVHSCPECGKTFNRKSNLKVRY